MKIIVLITALLIVSTSINAQDKFRLDGIIGLSDFYINTVSTELPDFMNYTEGVGNEFPEDGHFGVKATYAINKQWEISLEVDFLSMVTPITTDFRTTKNFNKIGWNFGIASIPFEIWSIEPYYENIENEFNIETAYYSGHTAFYTNNYFAGPYTGFNYNIKKQKSNLRFTSNGGIAWNKGTERYLLFMKKQSNYIYSDNYIIPSRPAFWIKPELEYRFALIDQSSFQLGIKVESQMFMTVKRLNYTTTHYEWTYDSGESYIKQLPVHWHHQLTLDVGFYIAIK